MRISKIDRKDKRGDHAGKPVPKKRKFQRNRYSFEANTEHTSTSAKKLKDTEDDDFCIQKTQLLYSQLFLPSQLSVHLSRVSNVSFKKAMK